MGRFLIGILLPLLLFAGSLLNWSLLSLVDLLASLFMLLATPRKGLHSWKRVFILWNLIIFSAMVIVLHIVFSIIEAAEGSQWGLEYAWWAKLFGFARSPSDHEPTVLYFVLVQLLVALVALIDLHGLEDSSYYSFSRIGSHFRALCCLLLPGVQLVVGISHPSWISLPFFICNCVGLVNWSLTSNFLGLFRWWRCLLYYAAFNIILLYIYQLPFEFPSTIQKIADLTGLYRISTMSDWSQICSGVSLVLFYFMLSCIRCDLMDLNTIVLQKESDLIEQLLPSTHSFFIHESRSGLSDTNILLREAVFQSFSINFFTYGFPISLFALSFWSFQFASFCAFGLLSYVGYILYAFPPLFHLHYLNGLLLIFILLWAASTYVFNVAFVVLNNKLEKDMAIWETIGLWHYSQPGLFLFAQFCLGVLVALGNLVNSSVFGSLSNGNKQPEDSNPSVEEKEETKVLVVATISWGLRKLSRAIVLLLILFIALRPGVIHAVYIVYFMIYLLSHTITRRIRQTLIFLCELHFALLYILKLNLVAEALEQKGGLAVEILSQLGLLNRANSLDFLKIAVLACCCSIQNHGFDILFLFSSIVQQTPFHPFGWSSLKAGLDKSVLFSVYTSMFRESNADDCSHERRIASYLNAIGKKFLSFYRSCGTYIVCLTILFTLYQVKPNYTSFGYLFLLLLWMNGRQLVGMTRRQLWFPLKIYSVSVFILIYGLGVSVSFKTWLSGMIDLYPAFGCEPDAPMLKNVWQSLAVLIVMELYSYERRQSKSLKSIDTGAPESGSISFSRRLLIRHNEKILYISLLYASLSPISAFGFVYLLGLVICSTLPKSSSVPSKLFIVYSGFLLMIDYLFQMWGEQAEMFPGQKQSYLSEFLGLRLFKPGFFGLESGLRANVLVIVACVLQYNVFCWLGRMPSEYEHKGKWEEPCALFDLMEERPAEVPIHTGCEPSTDINPFLKRHKEAMTNSWPSVNTGTSQLPIPNSSMPGIADSGYQRNYSDKILWGSSRQNQKWNRKWILLLRKERFDMQKTTLRIYLKYWVENMFNLFGLEINMIALLLASFAVLNAISLLYVASLVACVLVPRHVIRKIWPLFVFVFASVLTLEYLAIWLNVASWKHHIPNSGKGSCSDCWRNSEKFFDYCKSCWLGTIVDDPRMLISYYVVFMLACLKLRADHLSSPSVWHTYQQLLSQFKKASVLSDLSFETKSMWTFLDYLRLYSYCHLLDLVLALILITGTLEYDILHLGYLGFALVFCRLRLEILKKKNKIFKFLRIYNFSLIVLSLAYQSPFIGGFSEEKCGTTDHIYEVIGFYKYDYGFRITSRSALVEIVIYMLVALQSHMFSSQEFDYVSKYLEAEQIDALVREQEKRAAWKTAQLQHIRESEEQKHLQNMQVEKMKEEVLNLQDQLHGMSTNATFAGTSPRSDGFRRRRSSSQNSYSRKSSPEKEEHYLKKHDLNISADSLFPFDLRDSPKSMRSGSLSVESVGHLLDSLQEISEVNEKTFTGTSFDEGDKKLKENPLVSAVHLIGDGVSHVRSLGNKAVSNVVSFFNIEHEELDSIDQSSENETYYELESQNIGIEPLEQTLSMQSGSDRIVSHSTCFQIGIILRYIWGQMRANNDVVCYCSFVLIFLWNFSLLSMVYLAALFLYALSVNTGPSYMFWIIILIYSEVCISLQYLYQIVIQHCGFSKHLSFLQQLGFPENRIMSSFVISNLPLFLVYLFTLLQTSITAREGKWASVTEFRTLRQRNDCQKQSGMTLSYEERILKLLFPVKHVIKHMIIGLYRYWKSLTEGAETPPYFVQISMEVVLWPEDGIQPERIESGINKLLKAVNDIKCMEQNQTHPASRVRVQSIERSLENPSVALAVFEVEHASPSIESVPAEWYRSLTPAADVANEIRKAQHSAILKETGFPYPIQTVIGGGKWELDLYAYVFCADLAVFFLVAIFYQSVIKNNSEFLEVYQLEDQFPKEFVYLLMVIFFLIVLDRVIYLCSFATGKVIFYLISLVLFTYSITKYAWQMEPSHQHAGKFALRAIYLMKAISLALQAIQIRYGIPHESTLYRQFLTSNVTQINFLGFRLYRALPFLYELRCVLDWSCTTTSLTMYDWLKLEDIHASLFLVKCDVELNRIKHHQGQRQTRMTKFCNGICLFLVLLGVIWAPMLMYSSGNPTNIANPIRDAKVRIDLATTNGRLTLFETTLCEKLSWDELDAHVDLDPQGYLSTYNERDIQLICCQADASTLWQVPPVVQAKFSKSLNWSMNMIFLWQFTRDRPKGKEIVKYELHLQTEDLPNPTKVMEVLNGTASSFRIYNVYPRYFRVTGSGDVRFLEQPVKLVSGDLFLNRGDPNWWSFHDVDASDISGCEELAGPKAIIVSEETPQGILGETLSKFSIWGLYITFVLAVGRFIRLQCADLRMRIPFENLPSCDRLLAICENIYAARAEGALEVEEILYWTLVKIYRSPHMLLEYTKPD